jgi:pimeloyl-ACP methyl ester carboxylesterase
VTLAYDRSGSGPPLLLLHGLGMSRAAWRPVLPLLAREREVIAVDLPGFGASPPGPRTVEGLAAAVAALAAGLTCALREA